MVKVTKVKGQDRGSRSKVARVKAIGQGRGSRSKVARVKVKVVGQGHRIKVKSCRSMSNLLGGGSFGNCNWSKLVK